MPPGGLLRLFDFLLDRATTVEDLDTARQAIDAISLAVESHLTRTPFIYRKVGRSPFLRKLLIPFRGGGYVALSDIESNTTLSTLAVCHQRDDAYH